MANNPTWIEPPPQKKGGLGCFGKGCLATVAVGLLAILLLGVGGYFFVSRGVVAAQPTPMPVEELPPDALANVQQRAKEFRSTAPSLPIPPPAAPSTTNETPTPAPAPNVAPDRQLIVTAAEINGLIAANKKARGHAYVTLSGNTATVQVSIPTDKVPGMPPGYLNGSFNITTDGPTSLTALKVSKIEANGWSVPSGILSMTYRGRSLMGYALDATAPYHVSTVEVQDGRVVVR